MEDTNELLEDRVAEEPVRFTLTFKDGSVIDCRSGRELYEGWFGAKLEYTPRVIHNLNRGDITVWEWVETSPAVIPAALGEYISSVELSRRIYLTD